MKRSLPIGGPAATRFISSLHSRSARASRSLTDKPTAYAREAKEKPRRGSPGQTGHHPRGLYNLRGYCRSAANGVRNDNAPDVPKSTQHSSSDPMEGSHDPWSESGSQRTPRSRGGFEPSVPVDARAAFRLVPVAAHSRLSA